MPSCSFSGIDRTNGIKISGCAWKPGGVIEITAAQIAVLPGGNLKKKEERLNEWLQAQFEWREPVLGYEADHRIRLGNLKPHERIDGPDYVKIMTYVAVHIYDLSPLSLTVRTSREPITGDWW